MSKVLVLEEIWDGFQAYIYIYIYHPSVSNLINIEIVLTRKSLTERSLELLFFGTIKLIDFLYEPVNKPLLSPSSGKTIFSSCLVSNDLYFI